MPLPAAKHTICWIAEGNLVMRSAPVVLNVLQASKQMPFSGVRSNPFIENSFRFWVTGETRVAFLGCCEGRLCPAFQQYGVCSRCASPHVDWIFCGTSPFGVCDVWRQNVTGQPCVTAGIGHVGSKPGSRSNSPPPPMQDLRQQLFVESVLPS